MRRVRLAGFGVLALAAVGLFFLKPSGSGSDQRVVALLALLVLVLAWHFATLRRARREDEVAAAPPGPVDAPAPSPEDVVDRGAPAAPPPPFTPGAISPTEVLPPDAEVVPQGPSDEQFDMDAPPPGTPEPAAEHAAPVAHEGDEVAPEEPSLPAPPPEPQYKDGFEKWAAEMFGPSS